VLARNGGMRSDLGGPQGLGMPTRQAKADAKIKKMCADSRIKTLGEGALPLPGRMPTGGFYIRVVFGELLEVIPA